MTNLRLEKFRSNGRRLVTWLLVMGIALPSGVFAQNAPPPSRASWYSRLPGLDYLTSRWNGESNDPEVKLLIDQKIRESAEVPSDIRALQNKTLSSYFSSGLLDDGSLPAEQVEKLTADARRLAEYYEQNDNDQEAKSLADSRLTSFIKSLTPKKLRARFRNESVTEPIGEWTTESLVVREKLVSLARFPDRVLRTLSLVTGSHLRGATKKAYRLVLFSGLVYLMYDVGVAQTIMVNIGRAFTSGPMGAIVTGITACVLQPTMEYIQLWNLRNTGFISNYLNKQLDKIRPAEDVAGGVENNTQVKIAVVDEDGTNLGGQTRENQIENFNRMLGLVVVIKNHYFKLLREIQHAGRGLLVNPLLEEQFAATFIETVDTKMVSFHIKAMQVINPYQTRFLMRDQDEQKILLDRKLSEYEDLSSKTWLKLLSEDEMADIKQKIDNVRSEMMALGVHSDDMAKLWEIQVARAQIAQSLTTGLAVNEFRLGMVPENNRNAVSPAREGQRAIRRGFGLQGYVDRYLDLVAAKHREMGWANDGIRSNVKCETLLEKIVN